MLSDLPTPCLLLDRTKMASNIERMRTRLALHGVAFRPHVKTAKSRRVARALFDGSVGPITVSTLREAEYFLADGFVDQLYAVGIAVQKLERVAQLRRQGADLAIILDHPITARATLAALASLGLLEREVMPVMIEIDTDGHRAGLTPEDSRLAEVAKLLLDSPQVELRGVMTHAGESYECQGTEAIQAMAEQERQGAVHAAGVLRAVGVVDPVVSVGSTPTALFAEDLTGVTEVRSGVFVFQDLCQVGLGVCGMEDIAVSVLATVIGHRPDRGWVIVDAGGLALSKDRSTSGQVRDCGYGLVCDVHGRPLEGLVISAANQEHGMVTDERGPIDVDRLPLGSQVRILPNHACMTAAAYEGYQVLDGGGSAPEWWGRVNGW